MTKQTKEITFIFRLDEILIAKGRGIRELSRATQINVATISRIVNNHTKGITLNVLAKLCAELNISPGELFKVQ